MKFSLMVTADAMQVNLVPETDAERELCKTLAKHQGQARIHSGMSLSMCRGGYLRDFGNENAVAITITTEAAPEGE